MNFFVNRSAKRRLKVDGFYIGGLLCMIILAIKFFIDRSW
jgi:hypothetical protein